MVTMSEQSGFENWHIFGLEFLSLLQKWAYLPQNIMFKQL
jgi:hypothetical protein